MKRSIAFVLVVAIVQRATKTPLAGYARSVLSAPLGITDMEWLGNLAGGENELWLGESGVLPAACYVVVGIGLFVWMRRRGLSWQSVVRGAGIAN